MRIIKNHTKQKFIALALLLILAISVGYAALSTTLIINGTANIASNSWFVYFTNVQVKDGSVTATTAPSTEGTSTTTLTWIVNLRTPGDFYEYNVDVKNDGTIDAMIGDLSNTPLITDQAKYLNYSVTYSDGAAIEQYDKLNKNETITLKVRVEFKTNLNPEDLPSEATAVTLTYTSNYVQADENAKNRNTIASNGKLITEIFEANGSTEGKMHIGDYIDYPVYYDNVPSYVKSDYGNDINGYSTIQDFVSDDEVKKYIADDSYNGWKLLSVEEENERSTIKLISTGVPLNYLFQNDVPIGIRNLTVGFFDTQIISSLYDFGFYNLGFKQQNGTRVTNMSDIKTLFDNRYTLKYQDGEIATYTNTNRGNTTTVTNENVSGYPKVHSLTQEENSQYIPLVPCQGEFSSYYVPIWYPSYGGSGLGGDCLAFCTRNGTWRDNMGTMKCIYGVRVIVTLKSDVKFILSNESNSTDTIKIWELE